MTILSEAKSLNDVAGLLGALPQPDKQARAAAAARQMSLTKPPFALGRLEDLAAFMAAWQGTAHPEISKMQALVFAGNHGVCAQGVNPFPQDVTVQMVANFEQGGAAINQLCALAGAELSVIALDLETPTADFTEAAAMTPEETLDAMQRGAAAVDAEASVISLGEMGIGNSTISAALACAGFGGAASEWVGRGTGSDEAGKALKARVIEAGLARHAGLRGLDMLAALGGREQAALCGAVIEARARSIPVMLDGYICTAAVVPLFDMAPDLLDHCLVGHLSAEPGHAKLLEQMDKEPILTFNMALGEGTGAALALNILRGALACHNGMATFAEAGVADG